MGNQRWVATEQKKISLGVYDEDKILDFQKENEKSDPQGAKPNRTIEFCIWFR